MLSLIVPAAGPPIRRNAVGFTNRGVRRYDGHVADFVGLVGGLLVGGLGV
jgi:hypothetical protein